ncbi:MAG TPA: GAF domain-containing protein [Candidatus Deferrimicrobium sp.]|nr:GAF domain-containing protein [Candidatus Deferrimicrobium sp.]
MSRYYGRPDAVARESNTTSSVKQHLARLVERGASVSEIFIAVTEQMNHHLGIDKGVLVVREAEPARMTAVATWHNGVGHEGLALRLPAAPSLFEQVAQHGIVYTEDFCAAFSGNFYERKLLLDDTSRSFVLQPLKSHGRVVGLLGYSSRRPTAFMTFEVGEFNHVAEALGAALSVTKPGPA